MLGTRAGHFPIFFHLISFQKTGTKVTYTAKRPRDDKPHRSLGNAHHSLGDFKTAIDYHKRRLKIAKDLGDRSGERTACDNLGNAYYSLGDFKTALDYRKRTLKIAKELGDRSWEAIAYNSNDFRANQYEVSAKLFLYICCRELSTIRSRV